MKIETFSAEETYKIGEQMGREAKAGDVLCLLGDLGVGKTVFTQGFAAGLGIQNRSAVRHLLLCRHMTRDGYRFIILMFIGSVTLKRWRRSDLMNIFLVRASA